MDSKADRRAIKKLATPTQLPELIEPLDPGFVANEPLQDALDKVLIDELGEDFRTGPWFHAFAVVDLTDHPLTPAYAGWGDTLQMGIASLAKLLPLYCSYRLRAYLRKRSIDRSITNLTSLAKAAREHYGQIGAATEELPRIEKMFKLRGPGDVDFAIGQRPPLNDPYTDPDLHDEHERWLERRDRTTGPDPEHPDRRISKLASMLDEELDKLAFREQLRLMAGWSDNAAAAVVIQSLGFPYLWALTKGSRLHRRSWSPLTHHDARPSGPGGLFLAGDYNWGRWRGNTRSRDAPVAGPIEGGNARSLAALMTMLAQDLLIDHEAGVGIREMLRKETNKFENTDRGELSPIGQGMAEVGWMALQRPWFSDTDPVPKPDSTEDLAVSKIGELFDTPFRPGNISNALLVRAKRTMTITAVLVAINTVSDNPSVLRAFGEGIAKKLDDLHP